MQQIEKYGVIALVFLLVTIVAVSFWGDSKSPGFWSRLTGSKQETAAVDAPADPNAVAAAGAEQGALVGAGANVNSDAPVANNPLLTTNELAANTEAGMQAGYVAPTNVGQETTYTVKSGDSLAKIARTQLGSETRWSEIAQLNPGLNAKNLKVGQSILLPVGGAPAAGAATVAATAPTTTPAAKPATAPAAAPKQAAKPAAAVAAAPKAKGGRTYVVKSGDTLAKIAARECGSSKAASQIASLNPGINPDRIKVGDKLVLPASSGAKSSGTMVAAAPRSKSKVQ